MATTAQLCSEGWSWSQAVKSLQYCQVTNCATVGSARLPLIQVHCMHGVAWRRCRQKGNSRDLGRMISTY